MKKYHKDIDYYIEMFGIKNYKFRLSLRDPEDTEKYLYWAEFSEDELKKWIRMVAFLIDFRSEHWQNAPAFIEITPLGIVIEDKFVYANEYSPIVFIASGIIISSILQCENA